jgi:hypothetical protein
MHRRVEPDTLAVCPPLHVTARKDISTPLHACANTHTPLHAGVTPLHVTARKYISMPLHACANTHTPPHAGVNTHEDGTHAVCPLEQATVLIVITRTLEQTTVIHCADIKPLHVCAYVNKNHVKQIDTITCTQIPPNLIRHFILFDLPRDGGKN